MVQDIYAKNPENTAASGTTPSSMYCTLKIKPKNSEVANLRVTFSEAKCFDNALDKLSEAMTKLTDRWKGSNKPYWSPYNPLLLVQKEDEATIEFIAIPFKDVILPSHIVIEVASEAHSKEEAAISAVVPGNLVNLIRALPGAVPDSPPDLPIETKTTA